MAGLLDPLVDGLGDTLGGLLGGASTIAPSRGIRPAPTPNPEPPALAPEPTTRSSRPLLVLNPATSTPPAPETTAPTSRSTPPAGPQTTLTPNTELPSSSASSSSTTVVLVMPPVETTRVVDPNEVLPTTLQLSPSTDIPPPSDPTQAAPPENASQLPQQAGSDSPAMRPAVMAAAIAAPVVAVALFGIGILVWKTQKRSSRRRSMPYDEEFENLKKKHEEKFGVGHNY